MSENTDVWYVETPFKKQALRITRYDNGVIVCDIDVKVAPLMYVKASIDYEDMIRTLKKLDTDQANDVLDAIDGHRPLPH